jgi:hypothetical protein
MYRNIGDLINAEAYQTFSARMLRTHGDDGISQTDRDCVKLITVYTHLFNLTQSMLIFDPEHRASTSVALCSTYMRLFYDDLKDLYRDRSDWDLQFHLSRL